MLSAAHWRFATLLWLLTGRSVRAYSDPSLQHTVEVTVTASQCASKYPVVDVAGSPQDKTVTLEPAPQETRSANHDIDQPGVSAAFNLPSGIGNSRDDLLVAASVTLTSSTPISAHQTAATAVPQDPVQTSTGSEEDIYVTLWSTAPTPQVTTWVPGGISTTYSWNTRIETFVSYYTSDEKTYTTTITRTRSLTVTRPRPSSALPPSPALPTASGSSLALIPNNLLNATLPTGGNLTAILPEQYQQGLNSTAAGSTTTQASSVLTPSLAASLNLTVPKANYSIDRIPVMFGPTFAWAPSLSVVNATAATGTPADWDASAANVAVTMSAGISGPSSVSTTQPETENSTSSTLYWSETTAVTTSGSSKLQDNTFSLLSQSETAALSSESLSLAAASSPSSSIYLWAVSSATESMWITSAKLPSSDTTLPTSLGLNSSISISESAWGSSALSQVAGSLNIDSSATTTQDPTSSTSTTELLVVSSSSSLWSQYAVTPIVSSTSMPSSVSSLEEASATSSSNALTVPTWSPTWSSAQNSPLSHSSSTFSVQEAIESETLAQQIVPSSSAASSWVSTQVQLSSTGYAPPSSIVSSYSSDSLTTTTTLTRTTTETRTISSTTLGV